MFKHFESWLRAKGIAPTTVPVKSETHTLRFSVSQRCLCALQFGGAGSNEYARFRFYTAVTSDMSIQDRVVQAFTAAARTKDVKYSSTKFEERLDFYKYAKPECELVTSALQDVF